MRIVLVILFIFAQTCYAKMPDICVNIEFFDKFKDEYLSFYLQEAIKNNHTLKEAKYRLNRFRWEIKKAFSYELPELSAMPGYLGAHFPQDDYNIFVKNNMFILPLKVSFELDLLLKNKDKITKSKKEYEAELSSVNNLYITLFSDITAAYINILLYDYLIEKQEKIIKNKIQALSKENSLYKYGLKDKIALNKITDKLKEEETEYNNLIQKRETALFNFCNLIGMSAENHNTILRGDLEEFEYSETIPEIISSDLIYKRPDIIEIENKLKSAKIDITIAKKEFFPKFDITGFLVFDTLGIGNFFSWNSSFAFLLANATMDLFQGGRKIANLKIKKEKFNELMEEYKEKDLTAIKEINNALNLIKEDKKKEENYKVKRNLEKENQKISKQKLKEGIISELDYINNKNDVIEKEQDLACAKTARLVDYITLYKALGGNL